MDMYEMEIALNDGYTLTYVDDEYRQCFVESVGSEIVKVTRQSTFREEEDEYTNTYSLLVELDNKNIEVKIY